MRDRNPRLDPTAALQRGHRLGLMVGLLIAAWLIGQSGASAQDTSELLPVPAVSLASMAEPQRALLIRAVQFFNQTSPTLQGTQLGVAYGRVGLHYQAHGHDEAASACLANAMVLDVDNHRWPYFFALLKLSQGDKQTAAEFFRYSLKKKPDHFAALTRLGLLLVERGDFDEALNMLSVVASQQPGNAAALAALGHIALARDDAQAAADFLTSALQWQPQADALHQPLAQAYAALGKDELARSHEGKIGPGQPHVQDVLVALLKAHLQSPDYFVDLARRALDAGQAEHAVVLLDFATGVDPAHDAARALAVTAREAVRAASVPAPEAQKSAPAMSDPARTTTATLPTTSSVAAAPTPVAPATTAPETTGERASVSAPPAPVDATTGSPTDAAQTLLSRGRERERAGRSDAALADFSRAVDLAPQSLTARVTLAGALMRRGHYERAAKHYGRASASDWGNAQSRYFQGLAWLAAGRCDRAEMPLATGHQIDPQARHIKTAMIRAYAICPVEAGKRERAVSWAEALHAAAPSRETAETLAMALAADGRFDEAARVQREAIAAKAQAERASDKAHLKRNLKRYRSGEASAWAWPRGHAVFAPAVP